MQNVQNTCSESSKFSKLRTIMNCLDIQVGADVVRVLDTINKHASILDVAGRGRRYSGQSSLNLMQISHSYLFYFTVFSQSTLCSTSELPPTTSFSLLPHTVPTLTGFEGNVGIIRARGMQRSVPGCSKLHFSL